MDPIHQGPWDHQRAEDFLKNQVGADLYNASILQSTQLNPNMDINILDVGCSDGALAIAAYRQLASQTTGPIRIVGIDSSQYMVDQACRAIEEAASTSGNAIRSSVHFLCLNAKDLHLEPNLADVRKHFAGPISVIFCMNVMHSIKEQETQRVCRNLMSLMGDGGRFFFNVSAPIPASWATAQVVHIESRRLVRMANLAPPGVIMAAVQQVSQEIQQLAGVADSGVRVDFVMPLPVWMGTILRSFIRQGPSTNNTDVYINTHARFSPTDKKFYQNGPSRVTYDDQSSNYIRSTVVDLIIPGAYEQCIQQAQTTIGFAALQTLTAFAFGPDKFPFMVLQDRILKNKKQVFPPHGVFEGGGVSLLLGTVMVTLRRTVNYSSSSSSSSQQPAA